MGAAVVGIYFPLDAWKQCEEKGKKEWSAHESLFFGPKALASAGICLRSPPDVAAAFVGYGVAALDSCSVLWSKLRLSPEGPNALASCTLFPKDGSRSEKCNLLRLRSSQAGPKTYSGIVDSFQNFKVSIGVKVRADH